MLAAGVGWAQAGANGETPAESAASVRQIAEKRAAEWETLAKALDAKTARMLPCDPQAKEAVAAGQPGVGGPIGRDRRHVEGGR